MPNATHEFSVRPLGDPNMTNLLRVMGSTHALSLLSPQGVRWEPDWNRQLEICCEMCTNAGQSGCMCGPCVEADICWCSSAYDPQPQALDPRRDPDPDKRRLTCPPGDPDVVPVDPSLGRPYREPSPLISKGPWERCSDVAKSKAQRAADSARDKAIQDALNAGGDANARGGRGGGGGVDRQSGGGEAFVSDGTLKGEFLSFHNTRRQEHCSGPLEWDEGLAQQAQAYADECINDHSPGAYALEFGENMCNGHTVASCQQAWYDEINAYPGNGADCVAGGGPHATCHVTTMLWKASTHLGCAEGCPGGQGFTGPLHVCMYRTPSVGGSSPTPNIPGQYAENVGLKGSCESSRAGRRAHARRVGHGAGTDRLLDESDRPPRAQPPEWLQARRRRWAQRRASARERWGRLAGKLQRRSLTATRDDL